MVEKAWIPGRHTRQTVGEQMRKMRTVTNWQVNALTSHGITAAVVLVVPEIPAKFVFDREGAVRLASALISQLDKMGVKLNG